MLNCPKTTDKRLSENVFSMKWYIFCTTTEKIKSEIKNGTYNNVRRQFVDLGDLHRIHTH